MEEKEKQPEENFSCSPQEEGEERRPGREEASLIIVTCTREKMGSWTLKERHHWAEKDEIKHKKFN